MYLMYIKPKVLYKIGLSNLKESRLIIDSGICNEVNIVKGTLRW